MEMAKIQNNPDTMLQSKLMKALESEQKTKKTPCIVLMKKPKAKIFL